MADKKLREFSYSPGYSDMRGAYHREFLKKNEKGEWVFVSEDCESINDPTIITTYGVSLEAVTEFEKYLKDKDITSLKDRKDSDLFATDYSPWEYRIIYDDEADGRIRWDSNRISQYKDYSDQDIELLKELNQRFRDLRGEQISQEIHKSRR